MGFEERSSINRATRLWQAFLVCVVLLPVIVHSLPTRMKPWMSVRDSLSGEFEKSVFAVIAGVLLCMACLAAAFCVEACLSRCFRDNGNETDCRIEK